jgi:pSer/pThr/pTyr-binding forkhead associated (FHA) protein
MSSDPNKKSPRSFQCRDVLWETFEQMSRELECSVDYLINEAMKQYARQRGHGAQRTPYPGGRQPESSVPGAGPGATTPARSPSARAAAAGPAEASGQALPPPAARTSAMPLPPPRSGLPAPPPPAGARATPGHGLPASRVAPPPPLPQALRAPSPGTAANGLPRPPTEGATLTLVYQGERHPITKERFVIGRGKQSSDLTLRDPNVSRQHALIEFQDGAYFMVDMGSTNGVTYRGQRVARKPIGDGDVFHICDHELLFTYR